MDNLWKWLKKANARAVFFCLLVVLLAAIGWWAWKLMTPIRGVSPAPAGMGKEPLFPRLGMLAFLEKQKTASENRPANLFSPADGASTIVTIPPSQGTVETPVRPPDSPPPTRVNPPRTRRLVTVTYRGMYTGSDGAAVALIEDSKSRRSSFYPVGASLFGLTVKSVRGETLTMTLDDGSDNDLKRGVPQSFPETSHVD